MVSTTQTGTKYLISLYRPGWHNGYYSPDGYSKYYDRCRLKDRGALPEGEDVYGYVQALEHIDELKNRHKLEPGALFAINIITTVETQIVIK